MNYTNQEYARDVVSTILDACDAKGIPHPDIVTETGRAMVAHGWGLVYGGGKTGLMGVTARAVKRASVASPISPTIAGPAWTPTP